jgi:predicted AAA+ superfamily ATPase
MIGARIEIVPLAPLAQCEIAGAEPSFVARLFDRKRWRVGTSTTDRLDVCERLLRGGFPEAVARPAATRRSAWHASYLASLLQRDVRDLANIDGLTDVPRLLSLLAARTAALMNASEISRASGIAGSTLRRYLTLLEAVFLLQPLPAWSDNLGKRLVKAPKIHLLDVGLAAHLRGDLDAADRQLAHRARVPERRQAPLQRALRR